MVSDKDFIFCFIFQFSMVYKLLLVYNDWILGILLIYNKLIVKNFF